MGLLSASASSLDQTQQEAIVFITHLLGRVRKGGGFLKFIYSFTISYSIYVMFVGHFVVDSLQTGPPLFPKSLPPIFVPFFFLACFLILVLAYYPLSFSRLRARAWVEGEFLKHDLPTPATTTAYSPSRGCEGLMSGEGKKKVKGWCLAAYPSVFERSVWGRTKTRASISFHRWGSRYCRFAVSAWLQLNLNY